MATKKTALVKQADFDSSTVELIKSQVAVGATDQELQLFLYQAKKSGLDPLARQIYFIKRKVKQSKRVYNQQTRTYVTQDEWIEKATIQSSIDGFRVVAQRSGEYAGQDEPQFTESSSGGKPSKCAVNVYKFSPSGERYVAAVGVAYWNEYCPAAGQDFMWNKMPHTMLAKVAEALALRKAFPQDLSGLYTGEEMEQAEVVPAVAAKPAVVTPARQVTASKPAPRPAPVQPTPAPEPTPEPPADEAAPQDGEVIQDEEDQGATAEEAAEIMGGTVQTAPAQAQPAPASTPNHAGNKCEKCGKEGLTQAVVDYSRSKFNGQALCFKCQKEA